MSSPRRIQPVTCKAARVMGPFLVIVAASAIARGSEMRLLLAEFRASSVWPWVTGAFVVLSGLLVVTLHPYWRGLPAIIVSLLGWLATLKGFFLMTLPQTFLSFADTALGATAWWRVGFVAIALIGLYLTFIGGKRVPTLTTQQQASSPLDAPRAAA